MALKVRRLGRGMKVEIRRIRILVIVVLVFFLVGFVGLSILLFFLVEQTGYLGNELTATLLLVLPIIHPDLSSLKSNLLFLAGPKFRFRPHCSCSVACRPRFHN